MSLLDITSFLPVLLVLLAYAVGVMILYWVIRLAVRHAIRDAGEGRSRRNQ
jgi:cytochrome c biogenesis protein CcdA